MTNLDKPIRRRALGLERRPVVITLYPSGLIGLRANRTRKEYLLPLSRVYRMAVEAELEARRAEKRTRRGRATQVSRGLLTTGKG